MATTGSAETAIDRQSLGYNPSHARTMSVFRRTSVYLARHPLALFGTILTAIVLLVALFAPVLAPYNPNFVNLSVKLTPPNHQYWFGTDEDGRDLLSRIIYGCRLSVSTGLLVMVITTVVGAILGAVAGYNGGLLDEVIMRISDFFMAFPYLILAMAIAFTLGASMQNAILSIIVVFWPSYARLIRGQVTSIRHREFVDAARVLGAPTWRIIVRHILPQTWSSLVVKFSLDLGFAVIALASLGFIGLGAPPPTSEWGTMIADSRNYALSAWWYGLGPGLAIFLAVLGFNLVGDAVQELIEPS
ncbi:MAG TPA: ABC transporter permease, partial [Chloroflexota bacterium]|nr:ABC transporter permease [Chloroflexota bacterium]